MRKATLLLIIGSLILVSAQLKAQLLDDVNGDSEFRVLAYGDSLTYGVGDGREPDSFQDDLLVPELPSGYPARLQELLGINVENAGLPGDILSDPERLPRFPTTTASSLADLVFVLEGENDAIFKIDERNFENSLQKLINIAQHQGITVVLATLPPPCCDRKERALFTRAYSRRVRRLALINTTGLTDLEEAWDLACPVPENCSLFNRPEGLHPNTQGYDFMAQLLASTLLGIDALEPAGPTQLAQALGIEPTEILIVPRPQPLEAN